MEWYLNRSAHKNTQNLNSVKNSCYLVRKGRYVKKAKCVESRNEPSFQGEKSPCHMTNQLITHVGQKCN